MEGGDTGWLKPLQTMVVITFLELGELINMVIVFMRKPTASVLLKFGYPTPKKKPN